MLKGQLLVISASVKAVDLVRKIVIKAYEVGAKDVIIEWLDDEIDLIRFMHAPDEALKEFPMWKAKGFAEMAQNGAAFLGVSSPNPDIFKSADPLRTATWSKTKIAAMSDYYKYAMSGMVNWSRVMFATKEWAAKVFPNLSEQEGISKLWEYIFTFTKANVDNPIKAWEDHTNKLKSKINYLNNNI